MKQLVPTNQSNKMLSSKSNIKSAMMLMEPVTRSDERYNELNSAIEGLKKMTGKKNSKSQAKMSGAPKAT